MALLRRLVHRVMAFLRFDAAEDELAREVASHLTLMEDEFRRKGLTAEEARLAARRAFGGVEQVKETYRDQRGFPGIESLIHDGRYALRTLRKSPGFTTVAILTLAVGIGSNVTVFTLTNALLFRGLPFDRHERIVYIGSRNSHSAQRSGPVSWPDFQDWRRAARSFVGMTACQSLTISLSDAGTSDSYQATKISANTFTLIGQPPIIGRDFAPSDEAPGAPPVAILSDVLWSRRYGRDPAIIGQRVRINGTQTTVIGVMARGYSFPFYAALWMPLVPIPSLERRDARDLSIIGRLAEGVTINSARAEMATIGLRLARTYPVNQGLVPVVQNFHEYYVGPSATTIYESLWGAVGCVLLIACANLANLLLARATGRSREISIRMALGAGRWRIVRQLLIESVTLSAIGGVFGWWIAKFSLRLLNLTDLPFGYPFGRPAWFDLTMDYRVLGYLIAISAGAAILFGLAPALRLSTLDINAALKAGGRGATDGVRSTRLSALLVMAEMALAVVLLAGAGLTIRSFLNIYAADVGVKATNVLVTFVGLPHAKYPDAEAQTSFYARLRTRLQAIPGMESVAFADRLPTDGASTLPYELAGASPVDKQRRPMLSAVVVSPRYFRVVGAVVLSGREFNDADGVTGPPVAIVNQRFASQYWPGASPLGQRLRLFKGDAPEPWLTVVGVVSNIVQNDVTRQETDPLAYVPYKQQPTGTMVVFARTRVPPNSLATAFRHEMQAIDPDQAISPYFFTLAERLAWNYRFNGIIGILCVSFAGIAILLATIGLYAVMAHAISRRTQEIGIRMAMGGTTRDILTLVLRQGMRPVGIGLTIGLAAAFAVTPVLKSQLVHVSPADPVTLLGAAAVLICAGTFGCLIPARRAMRVEPVVALRHE